MTPGRLWGHPAARAEIRAAQRYYADRRLGLGRAFLADVDAVLAFAREHPEMYPAFGEVVPTVRRALLHRFPYALVYEVGFGGANGLAVLTCYDLRQERPPRVAVAAVGRLTNRCS